MAKILTPEQFRKCPAGTVFAYGREWDFGTLLVLDCIIGPLDGGAWGFYAIDPMWVDSDDSDAATDALVEMRDTGCSHPAETSSTKYMNYDGDEMDVFIVYERADWVALTAMIDPALTS